MTKLEDQGLGVKKFEEDADRNAVVSERTWQLSLKGKGGLAELPKTFRFAAVKVPTKETVFQRYADADLATVGELVSLERTYGETSNRWVWLVAAGAAAGLVVVGGSAWALTRRKPAAGGPALPERVDPFVAAALLRNLRDRPDATPAQRAAIDQDLAAVEQYYFSAERNGSAVPDLRGMVERWVAVLGAAPAPAR